MNGQKDNAADIHRMNIKKFVRGNVFIRDLSIGSLLIGCPPETLKDIMELEHEAGGPIPQVVVLRNRLFDAINKCICEELEQIIFYNFFKFRRKTIVVCTEEQRRREREILHISTFGLPISTEEITRQYPDDFSREAIPDLESEFKIFAADIKLDDIIDFHTFDAARSAEIELVNHETGETGTIYIQTDGMNRFTVRDKVKKITYKDINAPIRAPRIPFTTVMHPSYVQLRNAISFVSTSSGFDPIDVDETVGHAYGTTVSFIIWDDLGTGTVVDPPMGFPNWMRRMGIHFFQIQDLILTHTHFDHDVGTIERILEEPVNVHTTETIMQAFLEKSSALTGISIDQVMNSINFFPIKLHSPVKIGGFTYFFSHCIHPIETIRFTFQDHEGNTYYYSSDILYNRESLQKWVDQGLLKKERMEDIMTIPQEASIYIHEMGGPNIHTPPESIAAMPEHVRNNIWIVHTDTLPLLPSGKPIPGVRLARPGMIIPLQTPREAPMDEFTATYHMLSKLDRIPLFHNMPMTSIKDIREILRLLKPKRYEPGSQLIRYGERPEKLYILVDGGADIVIREQNPADKESPKQVLIHRNDFGFLIGDAVASKADDRRDADVYAGMQGITVLEIDEESIRKLEEKDIILGEMIRKNREMRKFGVYMALEKIPVVKDLTYSQKQEFALLCSEHVLKTDDDRWLIKQGEWNEYVYILAEGQAEVIVQERDGSRVARKRIATSESNIFGEISILTQSKTIATVYVTGDLDKTRVYKMHNNDFNNFLRNNPNFNLNFRKNMEQRIMETSQVRENLMEALRSISKEYLQKK